MLILSKLRRLREHFRALALAPQVRLPLQLLKLLARRVWKPLQEPLQPLLSQLRQVPRWVFLVRPPFLPLRVRRGLLLRRALLGLPLRAWEQAVQVRAQAPEQPRARARDQLPSCPSCSSSYSSSSPSLSFAFPRAPQGLVQQAFRARLALVALLVEAPVQLVVLLRRWRVQLQLQAWVPPVHRQQAVHLAEQHLRQRVPHQRRALHQQQAGLLQLVLLQPVRLQLERPVSLPLRRLGRLQVCRQRLLPPQLPP